MKQWAFAELLPLLQEKKGIHHIRRVADATLEIVFDDKSHYCCHLARGESFIAPIQQELSVIRCYNAPFDKLLEKLVSGAKICRIVLPENERIYEFYLEKEKSYKSEKTTLRLEFTGKHTNAILLDSQGKVVEALRHVSLSVSTRHVKVGSLLQPLPVAPQRLFVSHDEDLEEYLRSIVIHHTSQKLLQLKQRRLSSIHEKLVILYRHKESLEETEYYQQQAQLHHNQALLFNAYASLYNEPLNEVELETFEGQYQKFIFSSRQLLSAHAQQSFKLAKKYRQKEIGIIKEKENIEHKIEFLEALKQSIEEAKTQGDIERLFPLSQVSKTQKHDLYIAKTQYEGYHIWVGRNAKGNEELLKHARAKDVWFHLQGRPSAHVLVRTEKSKLPEDVVYEAAKICVSVSVTYKGQYLVDYTPRRNLHMQGGADVIYNEYNTLSILKE